MTVGGFLLSERLRLVAPFMTSSRVYRLSFALQQQVSVPRTCPVPQLQPRINGIPITPFNVDGVGGFTPAYNVPQDTNWHLIEANWFSGPTSGTIPIEIWDLATTASGNDFGIDDICFFECDTIPPPPPDTTCQCEIIKVACHFFSEFFS